MFNYLFLHIYNKIHQMPFTISHIAAILPLKKYTVKYFSFSALVIGSMAPDFEYFLRMKLYGHYGHRLIGIFTFDLPVSILLYILFHLVVREQFITHSPKYFYSRICGAMNYQWKPKHFKQYSIIICSIFIGIITHFIWDGFTHDEEYVVAKYFTFLLYRINIAGTFIPVHFMLQILSSVAGIIILISYITRMKTISAKQETPFSEIVKYWSITALLAVLIFILRCIIGIPQEKFFGQLIVISISSFLLSLFLISLLYKIK